MKPNHFKDKRLLFSIGIILACSLGTCGIALSFFQAQNNPKCPQIRIVEEAPVPPSSSSIEPAYAWQTTDDAWLHFRCGEISAIEFSPDGTKLVVGSSIGLEAFDPATGDRLWHTTAVEFSDALRFSSTGAYIAVHGLDLIALLDSNNGKQSIAFEQPGRHCNITFPHWSPSGGELVFGGGRKVYIWDVETRQITDTIKFKQAVTSVSFSPDGESIAVGFNNGRIVVYDLQADRTIIKLDPGQAETAEGHDHEKFPTGPFRLLAPDIRVADLAYTLDNRYLISVIEVLPVSDPIYHELVWDLETGKTVPDPDMDDMWSNTFDSPIAVSRELSNLLVRDTDTGQTIQTLRTQAVRIEGFAWSSEGQNRVAAGIREQEYGGSDIIIWDVGESEPIQRIEGFFCVYSPLYWDSNEVLVTGAYPSAVIAWNLETGEPLDMWELSRDIKDSLLSGDLTRYILIPGNDSPQLRDVKDDRVVKTVSLVGGGYNTTINLDGTRIALGNDVVLVDTGDEYEAHKLQDLPDRVSEFTLSSDGKILAVTHSDGSVTLWDTETGQLLHTLTGYYEAAHPVAFSDDGSQLATYVRAPTLAIKIWDTQSGQLIQTLTGPDYTSIRTIDFHPSGPYLAAGGYDQVMFWNIETGELVQTLTTGREEDLIRQLAWSPDGSKIAASSDGRGIIIWKVELN